MKKLTILLFLIIFLLGLCGCSYVNIIAVSTSSSSKMYASYVRLNGSREHTITVKDGEPVTVTADIVTKKGTLDVYIYQNKTYYCEKRDVPTSSFSVPLTEPGKYKLKIVADQHKGSYSFQW